MKEEQIDNTEYCQIHQRKFEELWKGQYECRECFEEYHLHVTSSLERSNDGYAY